MNKLIRFAMAAGVLLALVFMVSCSSDDEQAGISYGTLPYGGKDYKTVQIGNQTWMAENLNYAGGDGSLGVCYDDDEGNCEIYGRLYDWEAAMQACPSGWRLSSNADWHELIGYVEGNLNNCKDYDEDDVDGGYCFMTGTKLLSQSGWREDEDYVWSAVSGTDDYGFSALPGGSGSSGYFDAAGRLGYWWSSDEFDSDRAYLWDMGYGGGGYGGYITWSDTYKMRLSSVRCVKEGL